MNREFLIRKKSEQLALMILGVYSSIRDATILFFHFRDNRISASIEWNLKNFDMKYEIHITDLCRRKFCDGHNILVFFCVYMSVFL